ncbi:MAG: AmmeMemoRadiSam system radical SAM enzyme [Candidatus Omnitrophica bacterium]|nr:AmmeMemoRadiSam system radical SAM enzyme [Candidatus Omnitrophota bacterium]MDE2008936.1 AmmeMemoRadiSam system radical SAM enzyme [Candidatus Omnitrophota bacterium]MDE2213501.1 AmmeMemoRadiSam system radical SAM enzyme [Candidatus Omnitrophota bacterium]MDE2230598.1 AmmeMemoRadiSam system radical SAM enzyme [Candidatus Omnitrophota bacterium]
MGPIVKKILAGLFLLLIVGSSVLVAIQRQRTIGLEEDPSKFHEALYYSKLYGGLVQCKLCPNLCILAPGEYGICKARKNINGKLYSLVYGKIAAAHLDPIEKKPFFHVLPGAQAFSIATTGCNIQCLFCQNWEISQAFPFDVPTRSASPKQVVQEALASGARAIAFTYSEPVISYEYVLDIAKLAKQAGLKTLMVSNGYIEQKPLKRLLKYIDAFKVDFKGFDEKFYTRLTAGHLQPVLETMKTIHQSGVWLEIVTLLVTGQNDSDRQIRGLADWIKTNLGDDVPLHFSRFYPQYKLLNVPPTPPETVIRARDIAMQEGLKYVYTGNIDYPPGEITFCPESGEKVIVRRGMFTIYNGLVNGACSDGEKIPGIWD